MQSNGMRRVSGLIFGAFLALAYAYVAVEINYSALPDVALPSPSGGDISYYLEFLVAGALLGLLACWPDRIFAGCLMGWAAGVIEFLFLPWQNALGPIQAPSFDPAIILSLMVCLTPLTIGIRMAVESLPSRPGKSQILRQVGWPLVATALAITFGVFSLYTQDVKDDLQITQNLMVLAQKSTDASNLPPSLQGVQNWFPNAAGDYTLSWSKETDRLMWEKQGDPGTAPADRDNVIVVRFSNSFTVGCMFTLGKQIPVCANFEY